MRASTLLKMICVAALLAAPTVHGAEFAGGTGEPADPYRIATIEQLVSIGDDPNLLDKYFLLVSDLDLDPNLPGGRVFDGAVVAHDGLLYASPYVAFTGRFFGEGHTVRNLTIRTETLQYLGLFGSIGSSGRVYDLNVENVSIEGPGRVGALAGSNEGSIINCRAGGEIRAADQSEWVGGLVGTNEGGIGDCFADVSVTAGDGSFLVGGLVGVHRGRIANSEASGEVRVGARSFNVGGLAGGCFGGAVANSHAMGDITASDGSWSLGGLVGRADSNSSVVLCHADGSITGGSGCRDLGGLVGHLECEASLCYANGDITASGASHSLGGLVGLVAGGVVADGYASGAVTGGAGGRVLGGLIGQVRTSADIRNCYAVGKLVRDGASYDRGGLIGDIGGGQRVRVTGSFWDRQTSGAGDSAAGVGLTTAQMQDAETFRAARWDLAGVRSDGTADLWRLPADGGYPQLAAFGDPNDLHALQGAGTSYEPYEIATAEDLGAVRRYSRYAWYKLTADIDLAGITWREAPIPVLRRYFNGNGHRIANLTIAGGAPRDVGLFGRIESGAWVYDLGLEGVSISTDGEIASVGGLAGANAGTVVGCYVTGTVEAGAGSLAVGGVVGSNRQGIVADSYSTATVSASDHETRTGGLVGFHFAGVVSGCYAAGALTNAEEGAHIRPLVGKSLQFSMLASSYFLSPSANGGSDESGTPLTDDQMKQQTSFEGWDFARTWTICQGRSYPHFQWEQFPCDP